MRHLMFFIDGTSIAASQAVSDDTPVKYSNVFELMRLIKAEDSDGNAQITFYYPGISSRPRGQSLSNKYFASDIDYIIEDIYINLCSNYKINDKIYIFGFSRGAVIARALTGLISKCGILHSSKVNMFEYVWSYYLYTDENGNFYKYNNIRAEKEIEQNKKLIDYFNKSHKEIMNSNNIEIEFVGIFDCVFGNNPKHGGLKYKFHFDTFDLGKVVKTGIHILSISDTRDLFQPILWNKCREEQKLEQIWCIGVHSDIGGTYPKHTILGRVALLTMFDRFIKYCAKRNCLEFYTDLAKEIIRETDSLMGIVVNNCWEASVSGAFSKLIIDRKKREIGSELHQGQSFHPLVLKLNQAKLIMYNKNNNPEIETWNHKKINILCKNMPTQDIYNRNISTFFNKISMNAKKIHDDILISILK